jgi:electron transfer flavoprotein beta subunit
MKVLVAVKRVIDAYVKIRVKADGSGVETQNVKMAMNPFDEIAVEEALRLKEKGVATEVIAVSVGDEACTETLRTALALGADRAILVSSEHSDQPLLIAKTLAALVKQEQVGLLILGKQSIDGDNNQVGQMTAALLDWPQACFASQLVIENNEAQVTREVDGGLETIALQLPAVITTDLRLNTPRYATLPNIMKSKQKPLSKLTVSDLGVEFTAQLKTLSVSSPPVRAAGVIVNSVEELIEKLTHEAKVLG